MAFPGHQRLVFCALGCMFSIISAWLWHVALYTDFYFVVRIISVAVRSGAVDIDIECVEYHMGENWNELETIFFDALSIHEGVFSDDNITMFYCGVSRVDVSCSEVCECRQHSDTLSHRIHPHEVANGGQIQTISSKYKGYLYDPRGVLLARLKKHASTEYGIRYRFKEISSVTDYRSRHPLTNYNHFREYIQREADGETGVLLPEKPAQIALTSGTTGKAKMILTANEQKQFPNAGDFRTVMTNSQNKLAKMKGNYRLLRKWCILYVDPSSTYTKSGILMSSTTKFHDSDLTKMEIISNTPLAGFRISDEQSAYYVHALFSLRDRNTGSISGYFSSVVYGFLRLIETKWTHLVDDIERGTLSVDLVLPPGIRHDLEKHLVADPERAAELKREFQRGFEGIVNRVWPFLSGIAAITSGSFSVYADILRQRYCKGTVLYSALLTCSEGWLGSNLWPGDSKLHNSYICFPNAAFFEFIEMSQSEEDQPSTLLLHELKIGESYEMVITNMGGLYRYRLGDVMKVVDYLNKSPIVEFQYRIGEVLNIKGEKTSEDCIVSALSNTLKTWGDTELEEYACAENTIVDAVEKTTSDLPHYVIFVQLRGFVMSDRWEEQMKQLDEELCNTATAYRFQRNKGAIGTLRLVTVRPGSFAELREFIINNSTASSNQFKLPRKLRKREWVEFMLARTEK